MRRSRMSSPVIGRSSGSSTGERSRSAGGCVSPRPMSTEAPRNSRAATTTTPTTETTKPSTSGVDRTDGWWQRPHPAAGVALVLPRRRGLLDDRDDLVDVVGEPEQLDVVGRDRRVLDEGRVDPGEQAAPVLAAEEDHREAGDL